MKKKENEPSPPEHPFKAVYRAGVPLAIFETSDPAMTIAAIIKSLNGKADTMPILDWNCTRGLTGLNVKGRAKVNDTGLNDPMQTMNPAECLRLLADKCEAQDENWLLFWHNAQRFVNDTFVMQGFWNLRDVFKQKNCRLVGLAPTIQLPDELKQDCVVITESLPDAAQIETIIDSICGDAGLDVEKLENKSNINDTLLGLSAFAAEQVLAMSITKTGIDRSGLWERKRKMIEQTPGLSVWRGGETFADVGGCDNVKQFLTRVLKGNSAPRAVGFIDEIEKGFAGVRGDTSGVSQDQLQCFLTFMQDKGIPGMIFIGPPGAAKSAIAKAAGNEVNIPTVAIDMGGMKGSLVGESERRLRQALQVFDAVAQSKGIFIATCNSIGVLPPELRRRFTLGTFYFDLPSADERKNIWCLYMKKYGLDASQPTPNDSGWTGAEIKACCDVAWRTGLTPVEAANFIVPVSKSAGDVIKNLREQANGRFISASRPGIYSSTSDEPQQPTAGRRMNV